MNAPPRSPDPRNPQHHEASPTEPGDPLRFAFGRNWASFLRVLNDDRIREAERSLADMLGGERIASATFLDIGCGSGLFSLAAVRLGASRVHSFDYDPASVECARELRRRYVPHAGHWTIEQGSVLDGDYLQKLGSWDIVYSWGVLHHTGEMWTALEHATGRVGPGGLLFIAIYNDQGPISRMWTTVKRLYNRSTLGKVAVSAVFFPYFAGRGAVVDLARRTNPMRRYRDYYRSRGMSMIHDWIDWLGGFPFEVAKPEQIFEFCDIRGLRLRKLVTNNGLGCNEFVFQLGPRRETGPSRGSVSGGRLADLEHEHRA